MQLATAVPKVSRGAGDCAGVANPEFLENLYPPPSAKERVRALPGIAATVRPLSPPPITTTSLRIVVLP